ncbi:MAG: alpha/beta hydrolase [Pseudomonadota bacterium]
MTHLGSFISTSRISVLKSRAVMIGLACSALVLTGCATHSLSVLVPIQEAPQNGSEVNLLAITTRAPSRLPGQIYSGERGEGLSSHIINVSVPPNHQTGRMEWPSSGTPNPENEFAVLDLKSAAPQEAWAWFDQQETEGRLLIFVHGFNVQFADAVFRLAQITEDLSIRAAPVLFSWPSGGELLGYYYDRESANFSRDAFESVITQAAESENVTQIAILAHSMGSWLTMETLRQMSIRNGELPDKITDVVLAAPDLDIDVFEQQFQTLGDRRPHFTFLVSSDDRALNLSRSLGRGVERLGAIDPSEEPYKSRIEATPGVTVVDLSALEANDRLGHTKFAQSGEMVGLARQTLADDEGLTEERTSIGEQAGAVIITLGQSVAGLSE